MYDGQPDDAAGAARLINEAASAPPGQSTYVATQRSVLILAGAPL